MSDYSESEEECCARLSATLDSRLSFKNDLEWAGQGGGAGKHNSFHVDSFDEEEEEIDDLVLTSALPTDHICQVLKASSLDPSSPAPQSPEYATPIYPHSSNGYTVIDEGSDGGWNSDDPDIYRPESMPSGTSTMPDAYKEYGYGEWEDDLQAAFATSWKSEPEKVRLLVREMFEVHSDVYSLICYFLRRVGRRRPKKIVLHRLILEEFKKWKEEKADSIPKNAVLTAEHQKEVLVILSRCHTTYLEILSSLFELHTVPAEDLVKVVKQVMNLGRLKEAVTCIFTFGVQKYFSMEEVLLPLVALDKTGLVESYLDGSKELQAKFVELLDQLCEPGMASTLLSKYLGSSRWVEPGVWLCPNNKLNVQQLHKLGLRFVAKYHLDLVNYPNIYLKKASGFLHHLLHLYYVENSIIEANIDDILEPAVIGQDHSLQMQLVSEMVRFGDVPAAAKWARRCGLAPHLLPGVVQDHMTGRKLGSSVWRPSWERRRGGGGGGDGGEGEGRYLSLGISLSRVVFVNSRETLQGCWEAIAKYGAIIGLDSEWKLICDPKAERLAVMQVAVREAVYLLDMVALPQVVAPKTLRHFMHNLFGSDHNLKLGYSICSDLNMLIKSWPFVCDIIADPERVVDLKTLDEKIQKLQVSRSKADESTPNGCGLPIHPLYQMIVPTGNATPTGSTLPIHPLLIEDGCGQKAKPNFDPAGDVLNVSSSNGDCTLTSEEWGKSPSGLSLLVERYLGKPLDKSNQLSDWEKRPLRLDQIRYAALDAHCLLSLYGKMVDAALKLDPDFNITPYIHFKPHPQPDQNEP